LRRYANLRARKVARQEAMSCDDIEPTAPD
jgi:hypothetical protein